MGDEAEKFVDRFTLEQAIMNAWSTADDLDLLIESVLEDDLSVDATANTLIGLRQLHHLRAQKVFAVFEKLIETGKIV